MSISRSYIEQFKAELENKPQIAKCYWEQIFDAILDDVVPAINADADPDEWDEDDVRNAVGKVICERMNI